MDQLQLFDPTPYTLDLIGLRDTTRTSKGLQPPPTFPKIPAITRLSSFHKKNLKNVKI